MSIKVHNHCLHLDKDILTSHGRTAGSTFLSERTFKITATNVPGTGTGMKV